MRTKILFTAALAVFAGASVSLKAGVAAAPDEERTFEITVEGEDGLPHTGHATAKLVKTQGETATYALSRTVDGPSSLFATGRATGDVRTHAVSVELDAPKTPGVVSALGGSAGASGKESVKVSFAPSRPSEYEFEATWTADGESYRETWKELTRLTSNIVIHSPTESGSFGPDVTFDATVANADHVSYFVDGWPVAHFSSDGRHASTKRIWQAGWRRFVVKAYGKAKGGKAAPLIGEAETVFLAKGLLLTPVHGSHLTKERVRVEATPIGIDAKTIELRLDGAKVIDISSEPWGADVSLGANGQHKLEAVAYGPSGAESARTHSVVTLEVAPTSSASTDASTSTSDLPEPATHTTQLPELKGKPPIRQEPANPRNYRAASKRTIDRIVIHKAEGSLDATISWFQNPAAKVSAHYAVDDARIVQFVPDIDICWHTGNRAYNNRSIGIENSGFTHKNDVTDAHYQKLGALVGWLCKQHGIPLDRQHVIGHDEVPNPNWPARGPRFGGADGHQDPGPYFDWNKLMTYARGSH